MSERVNVYRVAPFSGANYSDNSDKVKRDETPCAICGKGIKANAWQHQAVVIKGGQDWARTDEQANDTSDPGFMGAYPIGRDCHRKYQIKYPLPLADAGAPDFQEDHQVFHSDKPDERADRFVTTGEGDLDPFGRPMRAGS